MIDPQQLHLILNHIPVVGAWWVLLLLAVAWWQPQPRLSRTALLFTFLLGCSAAAAFFSGEPAEETVEDLPRVVEAALESHEDLGKLSLILGAAAGLVGLGSWIRCRKAPPGRGTLGLSLILVLATAVLMAFTAHQGGEITRPELGSVHSTEP